MMRTNLLFVLILFTAAPVLAKAFQFYPADHKLLRYSGRVDFSDPAAPVLIGSGSFVEVSFSGDSCQIVLRKLSPAGEHNYVSIELDGEYQGRMKLEADSLAVYTIKAEGPSQRHHLKIYKATEAQNGNIAFAGVHAQKLHRLSKAPSKSIEFIGNSITCGMGIEWKEVPCDTGLWYDQHNAYWAYGPRVARALDAQFVLSSVSGIGIYRNWNGIGPVMPAVYDNLYLSTESEPAWNTKSFSPDLVSICLGTNDFSDGDGVNERKPFDAEQFTSEYIAFVESIYDRYPATQVCLITSPMVSGEKGVLFLSCLQAVKAHFSENFPDKKQIAIYDFEQIVPQGCGYHPDKEDHGKMAQQLIPFYEEVMGW